MSTPTTETEKPTKVRDNDGLHKRRGIWYYSLEVGGRRRFFSTKTRNYQEARKVRAEAIKAHQEHRLPTDFAKLPFEKLLLLVLEDRKLHLSDNTIRLERERSVPLLRHFTGRRVCEIDNAAIKAYQAKRKTQVGSRTVNLETKVLRTVLKHAKVWAHVADEFKPLKEDSRGPGRALEEVEERRLLEIARTKPGWDAAFYAAMIAGNTTMRGCELKGLRIGDVNLMDRQIVINRSKTRGGERVIPLNAAALWGFAKLLERATALGAVEPQHFLFPGFRYRQTKTAHGAGYDPQRPQKTWRTAWRSLCKAAGLPGLRFHDLRHTAITKLAESEASDQTIMSIAGHLDRKMLEHYSHIRNAAKRKAVDAMPSYIPEEIAPCTSARVQ
ncbi:MAG: site-specific integrase [Acidobacteriaceae bacterium]|nr:site-specific integrase [Acidobacteriaceae bacterium]